LTLHVEAWVHRPLQKEDIKVTEGVFTFLAIDEKYEPRQLPKKETPM
jgi:acyl-CoA hydrolase